MLAKNELLLGLQPCEQRLISRTMNWPRLRSWRAAKEHRRAMLFQAYCAWPYQAEVAERYLGGAPIIREALDHGTVLHG